MLSRFRSVSLGTYFCLNWLASTAESSVISLVPFDLCSSGLCFVYVCRIAFRSITSLSDDKSSVCPMACLLKVLSFICHSSPCLQSVVLYDKIYQLDFSFNWPLALSGHYLPVDFDQIHLTWFTWLTTNHTSLMCLSDNWKCWTTPNSLASVAH